MQVHGSSWRSSSLTTLCPPAVFSVDVFSCKLIHACYSFGQAISCHAFIDKFHAYIQLHGLNARTVTCGCISMSLEARLAYMHYIHAY